MSMNKRIAELRGECYHDVYEETGGMGSGVLLCRHCDESVSSHKDERYQIAGYTYPSKHILQVKPYDTDIACAMELWEEMIQAGLFPTLKTIQIDHCEIGYRMIVGDRHGETHEDYTRAKAIAGAWLKWKEG